MWRIDAFPVPGHCGATTPSKAEKGSRKLSCSKVGGPGRRQCECHDDPDFLAAHGVVPAPDFHHALAKSRTPFRAIRIGLIRI